jgi:hypothetical protein
MIIRILCAAAPAATYVGSAPSDWRAPASILRP